MNTNPLILTPQNSKEKTSYSYLEILSIYLWIFFYFDATPIYIQLILLDKKAIPITFLLIIWTTVTIIILIKNNRFTFNLTQGAILVFSLWSITTLFIHTTFQTNTQPSEFKGIYAAILSTIAFSILLSTQKNLPRKTHHKDAQLFFQLISIPIILFGVYQILFGYSATTIRIFNEIISNVPYSFYNLNRPFSIFTQSSYFGLFSAFMLMLAYAMIKQHKKPLHRLAYYALSILFATACILSFTRISILASILMVVFYTIFTLTKGNNTLKALPLIYFGTSIFILLFAENISDLLKSSLGTLTAHDSTDARTEALIYYISLLTESSVKNIFIGLGPETVSMAFEKMLYIDNTFLSITLNSGVIGLMLWIFASTMLWLSLFNDVKKNPTPIGLSILSFWSTWLAVGVFSNDLKSYLLMGILYYAINHKNKQAINQSRS